MCLGVLTHFVHRVSNKHDAKIKFSRNIDFVRRYGYSIARSEPDVNSGEQNFFNFFLLCSTSGVSQGR